MNISVVHKSSLHDPLTLQCCHKYSVHSLLRANCVSSLVSKFGMWGLIQRKNAMLQRNTPFVEALAFLAYIQYKYINRCMCHRSIIFFVISLRRIVLLFKKIFLLFNISTFKKNCFSFQEELSIDFYYSSKRIVSKQKKNCLFLQHWILQHFFKRRIV